ncbi:uncharacterized protein F4817DRAFT_331361 [Daldinia loculata]|uniref:uncharacterized protein n=1 Tax=Daldinia loculata TaxID=103429 RepID=UPI0020C44D09|nr:uncharacterized protein F4817DRAFT_331361 [Daldinia loculata]KAI1649328.1 hypothetical protein F4817DRAFT_331361 [Daldinia loculata]
MIVVYVYGHWLRRWSKFAQTLAEAEAEAEAEIGLEINVDAPNSGPGNPNGITARINGETPNPDLLNVDRIVHFLPPESLPGSRAGSRYPSAANTPTTTRPSSLDVERLAINQLHGSHLSQHGQARPVSAPVRSQNVSPVPEAGSSDDISMTCSNCSGQTLAGTCTQCTHKSTRSPNSENASPSTSLRQVENAELNTVPEVSPVVIAPPAENSSETPAANLPKEKKRRFSGTCRMM